MATRERKAPKTLTEAIRYFGDEDRCIAYLAARRWPTGDVMCPQCGSTDVTYLKTQRRWKCKTKHPKQQFSVKVGTIFENSPLPLTKWLPTVWMIANCKNGISSLEVHRALGVTQKTAWFMLHRIRLAMQGENTMLGGNGKVVEADETFIGAKARAMNARSRRKQKVKGVDFGPYAYIGKAMVFALLERGGRVRAMHLADRSRGSLLGNVAKHVRRGSEIHTDEYAGYAGLSPRYYEHKVVNHGVEYVSGNVHTNNVENFWNCLKRTIRGSYVSVEPFHLFRYLDEQAFRFNERHHDEGDGGRFAKLLALVAGRRLTYKELIGAGAPAAAPA